ncbi:hypothetical protein QMK19_21050 [Streptomyces sp. H10-C2]|uniref:hypothetical protein n=1 Tax=unclassified Streptomyces TaxID=2593676 RepID=UPI0024BBB82B|nr:MULTISPECIES: hypothetical protein [unclassified Streptomyces]MDJ0344432.1 hypothetical protein [Streptomyces sp. PH10-H1]MDJ0372092.1 hypothetical protein [Streptomyces sp. H10-C2]
MTVVVTFTGRAQLPGAGSGYQVWSYRVEPSSPGELTVGQQVALAFPDDTDVQDPSGYPGVPQLAGTFVQRHADSGRVYAGRSVTTPGAQTISFVAPVGEARSEVQLLTRAPAAQWTPQPYATGAGGVPGTVHSLAAPVRSAIPPVFNGRPAADFLGSLPYASELFGVYQPLAGWFGRQASLRAAAEPAFSADALPEGVAAATQGVLSPVGLVNLFREYFFEFDTFLGPPAGHLWISPGGTVEVVETSTRRTLVEKVTEQSEETSRKVEESLTQQDDVADAVKEDNANDTKLGVSANGGVDTPVYHANASASFNLETTVKRSSEQTHKHTRTQSSKVTSEIKRNFKTSFRTVTESTDTTSRRYVVQNTTDRLVNYELRRKMRKVGVQVQHIGARLSWQVYMEDPGRDLGMGELVHVVPAPDLTSLKKPDALPYPTSQQLTYHLSVPFVLYQGDDHDAGDTYQTEQENIDHGIFKPDVGTNDIIQFRFDYPLPPPPPGFALSRIGSLDFHGAQVRYTVDAPDLLPNPNPATNNLTVRLTYANFGGSKFMPFDAVMVYEPTKEAKDAVDKANGDAKAAYDAQVAELQREAYANAVRDRLKVVSSSRPRPSGDLRSEERQTVYGNLVRNLEIFADDHLGSELIRQIFDVDEMLYFVAPDFWKAKLPVPSAGTGTLGRYPVPKPPWESAGPPADLTGQTVAGWYTRTDAQNASGRQEQPDPRWRSDYLITEQTQPAPNGSSLGWLIQIDGDVRRNEFLNAAWAKAVLPVRPGQELAALAWLSDAKVEGESSLETPYVMQPGDPADWQGKTFRQVLQVLATALEASNTDIASTRATEKVFETGFDPLDGGFRPAAPYQVFDQWTEVLPTDQIVAVDVDYDPRTGQQL